MAGEFKTVVQTHKFPKILPIVAGVVLSVPLIFFGVLAAQNVFTRASNSQPQDVVVSEITETSAKIQWTTDQATQAVVEYGTSPTSLVFYAPESAQSQQHTVDLTLLTPSTTHYFQVRIGDTAYDNGGVPWTFTTKGNGTATTPEDPLAPDSAEITPNVNMTGNPTPTPSQKLTPTPLVVQNGSPSLTPTMSVTPSITPTTGPYVCNETDCQKIRQKFGFGCNTQDYIKCLRTTPTRTPTPTGPTSTPTTTPTPTRTPTPTP